MKVPTVWFGHAGAGYFAMFSPSTVSDSAARRRRIRTRLGSVLDAGGRMPREQAVPSRRNRPRLRKATSRW